MERLRSGLGGVLAAVVLELLPVLAAAQGTGTLAIYDDEAMTLDHGAMDDLTKVVYLGVRIDPPGDGFTGLEFSIAGLEALDGVFATWLNDPVVVLGTLAAPADTIDGTGGINVAWPRCQPEEIVVARILLIAISPPQDVALVVRRRYPPTNPFYVYPWAPTCDVPCFGCHYRLTGGTYTLNPTVGVQPMAWSAIKGLYRTP